MSTFFILFYIAALVAAILALVGIVHIANGLVNKNKKGINLGTILTGISVFLIITGLFFGARKCFRFCQKKCNQKEMNCKALEIDKCKMHCDSTMKMDDYVAGDSGNVTIDKKCEMHGDKPCDPAKCEHKCKKE
jgi:hypothetical protein